MITKKLQCKNKINPYNYSDQRTFFFAHFLEKKFLLVFINHNGLEKSEHSCNINEDNVTILFAFEPILLSCNLIR